ncbi:MAG: hypothetical protein QXN96_00465 [Candidatus Bathyarchaeia archaeon]
MGKSHRRSLKTEASPEEVRTVWNKLCSLFEGYPFILPQAPPPIKTPEILFAKVFNLNFQTSAV